MANLSWKLGAVLRGEATDDLLESYGTERKAHVTELTQRIKAIGQLIGERDTALARARDVQLLAQCQGLVKSVPRQDVQPALQHGILSPQAHPARGTLFPQPWVVQGTVMTRLDEVAGTGWRMVVRGVEGHPAFMQRSVGSANLLHPLHLQHITLSSTPQLGALQETDGVVAQWFEKHQCVAALVRPDHYVFGVAATTADVDDLVRSAERQVTQAEHAAKVIPEKLASLIGDTV